MIQVGITDKRLDPVEHIDFVRTPDAGAIVYFGGTTRKDLVNGKLVILLEYDCHKSMAEKTLYGIATEAIQRFAGPNKTIHKVAVTHRTGPVPVGEDSVMIAVSGLHRREAWECGEWILEEVKRKVEVWKKEIYEDGGGQWLENGL